MEKRVLKNVIHSLAIAQHPIQKADKMVMMTLDERFEGLFVALSIGFKEGFVGGSPGFISQVVPAPKTPS